MAGMFGATSRQDNTSGGMFGAGGAAAPTPSSPGWGLNPLSDVSHALGDVSGGVGALSNWVGQHTQIGNVNLGLGGVINTVGNIVPGLANIGVQAINDTVTGKGGALGQLAFGLGKGLANQAVNLFTDLGTAGGLAPWTQRWENEVGNVTNGFIQPTSLYQQATTPGGGGLLGGALNDFLTADLGAGAVAKVATLGDIGEAAVDAGNLADLAKKNAVDTGVSGEGIDLAGEVAKGAAIQASAEKLAEASGGNVADFANRITERMRLLESVDSTHQVTQQLLNPLNPLFQLGRAANATIATSGAESLAPPEIPVSSATSTSNAAEGLPGASEGIPEIAPKANGTGWIEPNKLPVVTMQVTPGMIADTAPRVENIPIDRIASMQPTVNPDQVASVLEHGPSPESDASSVKAVDAGGGNWILEDGNHRVAAAQARGETTIPATVTGTVTDPGLAAHVQGQVETTTPTPEPAVVQKLRQVAQEQVPAAYDSYLRRNAPIPKWAQSIVKYLPAPFVHLLAMSDDLRLKSEAWKIRRQSQVALNVVAREAENDPRIVALKDAAVQTMTDRIPGMTPGVASDVVGERVRMALVLGPWAKDLEELRPQIEAVSPGLVDHLLHLEADIPPEYDTAEFRGQIAQLADGIRQMRLNALEALRGSRFLGGKGLENADLDGAIMTKGDVALSDQIQGIIQQATETEAAGRQRVGDEVAAHAEEARAARESAMAPSAEGERARAAADQIQENGRDAAQAKLIDLRQQVRDETRTAAEPHPESAELRSQDEQIENTTRSNTEVQARLAREEQARQIQRSQGDLRWRTGDPNAPLSDTERLDAIGKASQAAQIAQPLEARLAEPRITDTTLIDRADQLDQQWHDQHVGAAADARTSANELERQIESGTLPTDRQADLVRQNAAQADLENERTQAVKILRANKAARDLQAQLERGETPEARAAAKLRETAAGKTEQLNESLSNASARRVAPKFGPLMQAGRELSSAVEQYPELGPIVEELPKIWGDIQDYADGHGFDPTHMPDMTRERVRQLINGTVQLGGQTKEFTSGTREARTGALSAARLEDRSIEAIIAGVVHATQEERTNQVVDWIHRVVARPMVQNARGAYQVPEGSDGVAWDPIRRGMLSATNPEGEVEAVPGAEHMWIPKSVARSIDEYSSTTSNPLARISNLVTNPWRFFMLTLSPAFYLHHIVGHMLLALIQEPSGFHWSDWSNAWGEAKEGFQNLPQVTGQNITKAELGESGVVEYPDFRTALAQGGKRAAAAYVTQFAHKVIAVSDSFARAVDYFGQRRTGATDLEALQHANTALVDYGNLSPFERTTVRSLIPFYGFQKGILKIALSMPADHPLVTSVLMQIGNYQTEHAVDANGNPLPTAYQGVVRVLGHNVNLKSMSPFKDLGALTTSAGIVQNLQYAISAMIHQGLNAPSPFTKAGVQVDQYGKVVPKVSLWQELGAAVSSSPQAQLNASLQGETTKTPAEALAGFAGLPIIPQTTINAAGARNVLSSAEVANATPAQANLATSFPVDTNMLQNNLSNTEDNGTTATPQTSSGQTYTADQVKQMLADAIAKQQAAAAAAKASGVTRAGLPRKRTARRARRAGSGSHRTSHKGVKRVSVKRASVSGGARRLAAPHITKAHFTKSFASSAIKRLETSSTPKPSVGAGKPVFKSSVKGAPKAKKAFR
jgi:hypothetical protein